MKKVLISATLLIGMMASAMVLSSFSVYKQNAKAVLDNYEVKDDGWSYWTEANIIPYQKENGKWVKSRMSSPGFSKCRVERREWCGEKEYRIRLWEKWYPVTSSPVGEYKYAFYGPNNMAYCFDM